MRRQISRRPKESWSRKLVSEYSPEIDIEEKERQKRVIQARGIAEAMEIVKQQLTNQYLQHEAIEAQKAMVNSPNNTVVYIPVGNMGVPLVGTIDMPKPGEQSAPVKK